VGVEVVRVRAVELVAAGGSSRPDEQAESYRAEGGGGAGGGGAGGGIQPTVLMRRGSSSDPQVALVKGRTPEAEAFLGFVESSGAAVWSETS